MVTADGSTEGPILGETWHSYWYSCHKCILLLQRPFALSYICYLYKFVNVQQTGKPSNLIAQESSCQSTKLSLSECHLPESSSRALELRLGLADFKTVSSTLKDTHFWSNDVITSCCYCKCGLLSISLVSLTIHNRGFYLYWELCEAIALEWGIEQDFLAHQWGIRQWHYASKLLSGVLNIVYSLTQWSVFISVFCPSVAFMLIKISNLGGLIHLADALTRMQKPTYF